MKLTARVLGDGTTVEFTMASELGTHMVEVQTRFSAEAASLAEEINRRKEVHEGPEGPEGEAGHLLVLSRNFVVEDGCIAQRDLDYVPTAGEIDAIDGLVDAHHYSIT